MDLKPGRVLERNPKKMKCCRYCINMKTSRRKQGKRPGKSIPCGKGKVSKIKKQTRAVAGRSTLRRARP